MKSSRKTFAELAAWLDRWNENGAAPSGDYTRTRKEYQ